MSRNPNIAVVTIGYSKYAFENSSDALELMALMSKAVQVDDSSYGMEKITHHQYWISDGDSMPALKFVATRLFNPNETRDEVKARWEREQKDREDLNQEMNEAPTEPTALPAPTINDEGISF